MYSSRRQKRKSKRHNISHRSLPFYRKLSELLRRDYHEVRYIEALRSLFVLLVSAPRAQPARDIPASIAPSYSDMAGVVTHAHSNIKQPPITIVGRPFRRLYRRLSTVQRQMTIHTRHPLTDFVWLKKYNAKRLCPYMARCGICFRNVKRLPVR